jgi:hypothetical protein
MNNLFVSNIPLDWTAGDLEEILKDVCNVKWAKVSYSPAIIKEGL